MQVQQCMTKQVFSCRADASMEQAARLMWEHDCGVLPVVDGSDRLVGLVTDRDLAMGAYTQGGPLRDARVETAMARDVHACRPTDTVEDAIRVLGDHQVRRVPVVDGDGKLVGLLSMNDLFRCVVSLDDGRERASLSARLVEAMASICEPHEAQRGRLEARPVPPERTRIRAARA